MTHDELHALPDVTPRMGYAEEVRDGRRVRIPVMSHGHAGALWQEPDDPIVVDADGTRWMVGRLNGERVRREMA